MAVAGRARESLGLRASGRCRLRPFFTGEPTKPEVAILWLLQFFLSGPCLAAASLFGSPLLESAINPIRAVWSDRLSPVLGAPKGKTATRSVRTCY